MLTNRQYAFARILGDEAVVVAVNNDEQPAKIQIPLPMEAKACTDAFTGEEISVEGGKICAELNACGSIVIKVTNQ